MGDALTTVGPGDAPGAIEALERDGAVIVERAASAEDIAKIRQELAPHFAAADLGFEEYHGVKTRRIGMLVAHSPTMHKLFVDPTILAIGAHFLGGENAFQLHGTEGVDIGPGNGAQPLHTDDRAHFPWPPRPRPELMVVALLAIDDFVEENGATRVVVGSHRWPEGREPTPEDPVAYAAMPKGSVLIVLASTWHSGGANRSAGNRIGLIFRYSRGWLRQGENMYLVAPPSVAKHYDETLRGLLGYRIVNGLGFVRSAELQGVLIDEPIPEFILEAIAKHQRELASTR